MRAKIRTLLVARILHANARFPGSSGVPLSLAHGVELIRLQITTRMPTSLSSTRPSWRAEALFSVNVRRRLKPELPRGYYGNDFVLRCTESTAAQLTSSSPRRCGSCSSACLSWLLARPCGPLLARASAAAAAMPVAALCSPAPVWPPPLRPRLRVVAATVRLVRACSQVRAQGSKATIYVLLLGRKKMIVLTKMPLSD